MSKVCLLEERAFHLYKIAPKDVVTKNAYCREICAVAAM